MAQLVDSDQLMERLHPGMGVFLLDNTRIIPSFFGLVYEVHLLCLYCPSLEEPYCNPNTMRNLLLLCLAVFSYGIAQAQDHTVLAGNYYYNPATLTVTAGETIEFLNEAGFHNVNGVSSTLGDTWNNP